MRIVVTDTSIQVGTVVVPIEPGDTVDAVVERLNASDCGMEATAIRRWESTWEGEFTRTQRRKRRRTR